LHNRVIANFSISEREESQNRNPKTNGTKDNFTFKIQTAASMYCISSIEHTKANYWLVLLLLLLLRAAVH